jgi:hypothetical protein
MRNIQMNRYKKDSNDKKAPLEQYKEPKFKRGDEPDSTGYTKSSDDLIKEFDAKMKARSSKAMDKKAVSKKFKVNY